MSEMKIQKLTPAIGAEITGITLGGALDPAQYQCLYEALLENQVIFMRDQAMSPRDHVALAESFGTIEPPHPSYPHVVEQPEIVVLDMGEHNPPDTDIWHTDMTYRANPPFASVLYSRVVPPVGGDTLWSSMTAAYDALPAGVRSEIENMKAIHDMADFRNDFSVGEQEGPAEKVVAAHQKFGSAIHSIVKVHPVTGKKYLYANPCFTNQIVGMNVTSSRRLLDYLQSHMNQPQFQVRFRWTADTVAIWDNRCTMHLAIGDYLPHRRIMHRVTVLDDRRSRTATGKALAAA